MENMAHPPSCPAGHSSKEIKGKETQMEKLKPSLAIDDIAYVESPT